MSTPLYREEASQALQVRLEGDVVAFIPPSITKLAFAFLVCLIAAVLFMVLEPYTEYVTATGTLMPKAGLIPFNATASGEITQLDVQLGQKVSLGQVLGSLGHVNEQVFNQQMAGITNTVLRSPATGVIGALPVLQSHISTGETIFTIVPSRPIYLSRPSTWRSLANYG